MIDTVDADVPQSQDGRSILKPIRQIIVFVLGMSVLVIGIAMIILPGPATVVIPAGLAILATEFAWAARWLSYLKRRAQEVAEWTSRQTTDSAVPAEQKPTTNESVSKRAG